MRSRHLSAVVLSVVLPIVAGCGRAGHAAATDEAHVDGERLVFPPASTQLAALTTVVATSDGADSLDVPGRVVWDENATVRVFAPFAGRVAAIRSDAGAVVDPGDTLALIASPDFGQAMADARRAATDAAQAERTASRTHELFAHGVVARKDVEAADADLARARTERQRAWARVVPYSTDTARVDQVFALRSPLAGRVVERNITPGQEVRPDQMLANDPQLVAPLFVVSDPSRLWVSLDLPERDVRYVRSGMTTRVRAASLDGRAFVARISWVASYVDPLTRTVKARAVLANPGGDLRAEMLVSVRIPRPDRRGLLVPASAVLFKDGAYVVFVDEGGGRLRRCTVAVAGEHDGAVTVAKGIAAGERVVATGALLLEQLYQSAGKL